MISKEEFLKKYTQIPLELTKTSVPVLHMFLEGKTISEIAKEIEKSESLVRRRISEVSQYFLGFSSRKRLVEIFYKYQSNLVKYKALQKYNLIREYPPQPSYPEGVEPLDSFFYLERHSIDLECYKEILKEGCLIRIKAPKQMGKTSLIKRILDVAEQNNCLTVELNFLEADRSILENLDNLCHWLCGKVAESLNLEDQLDTYWKNYRGSILNSINYFEKYILPEINCSIVLALDELDRIFSSPQEIYEDFFAMLRSIHQKSTTDNIWRKLKLLVTYSTEYHVTLNIDKSPFNVGFVVELTEFTKEQIQELTTLHRLDWTNAQIEELMEMVGGHPLLVRLAMYHVTRGTTLKDVLRSAATNEGIYSEHLLRILEDIKKYPELVTEFRKVLTTDTNVELYPTYSNKLYSMGLIHKQGDRVRLRGNLYHQYFNKFLEQ